MFHATRMLRLPCLSLASLRGLLIATTLLTSAPAIALEASSAFRIENETILTSSGQYYFLQSSVAVVPGDPARILMTTQEMAPGLTHGYRDMLSLESVDNGRTWSQPGALPTLARTYQPEGHEFVIGDVSSQWHAATGRVLATGKTFGWVSGKENRGFERVSYAVYTPATGRWSDLRLVELPEIDHEGRPFLEPNAGCTQRFDLPNGDILLPIRYRKDPANRHYTTIVARCRFDGEKLAYIEHGSEFTIPRERGLYEPSVTGAGGRYFLTMRADHSAFVARSKDGLNYEPFVEWKFDDGEVLGSYNTQQHWVTHDGELYLVYTRRGANNDHIMRHRAPLFIAQVDPERLCVLRKTEQVLIPENNADLATGFTVTDVSPTESWVIASELPTKGSRNYNRVLLARLLWLKPR